MSELNKIQEINELHEKIQETLDHRVLLYFEIVKTKSKREIINICYTDSSIHLHTNDLGYNKFVRTYKKNQTHTLFIYDEDKIVDYLKSLNYPWNNSLNIADKILVPLVSLFKTGHIFVNQILEHIVKDFYQKTSVSDIDIIKNFMFEHNHPLKIAIINDIDEPKPLPLLDSVFPSLILESH